MDNTERAYQLTHLVEILKIDPSFDKSSIRSLCEDLLIKFVEEHPSCSLKVRMGGCPFHKPPAGSDSFLWERGLYIGAERGGNVSVRFKRDLPDKLESLPVLVHVEFKSYVNVDPQANSWIDSESKEFKFELNSFDQIYYEFNDHWSQMRGVRTTNPSLFMS